MEKKEKSKSWGQYYPHDFCVPDLVKSLPTQTKKHTKKSLFKVLRVRDAAHKLAVVLAERLRVVLRRERSSNVDLGSEQRHVVSLDFDVVRIAVQDPQELAVRVGITSKIVEDDHSLPFIAVPEP